VLTEARQRKVNKYDALARTIQQIQRSESWRHRSGITRHLGPWEWQVNENYVFE
jgi:hypothetical protein